MDQELTEALAVLKRCELALKSKASLNETERLELWRDVSIAVHDLDRLVKAQSSRAVLEVLQASATAGRRVSA